MDWFKWVGMPLIHQGITHFLNWSALGLLYLLVCFTMFQWISIDLKFIWIAERFTIGIGLLLTLTMPFIFRLQQNSTKD